MITIPRSALAVGSAALICASLAACSSSGGNTLPSLALTSRKAPPRIVTLATAALARL
jgi:hypothetical protein